MEKLSDLTNIGKVIEQSLQKAGIHTPTQLMEEGSRAAFLKVRLLDPGACLRVLYSLEGAITGVRDVCLPQHTREELKAFYDSVK